MDRGVDSVANKPDTPDKFCDTQATLSPQRAAPPGGGHAASPPPASAAAGGGVPGLSPADAEQAQMRRQIRVVRDAVDGLVQNVRASLWLNAFVVA